MDDRELLERAARAAGVSGSYYYDETDEYVSYGIACTDENDCPWTFNPLENDGDAFRLMAALEIDVAYYMGFQEVEATPYGSDFDSVSIDFTDDRNKDTRRAIVRAAAAMGDES